MKELKIIKTGILMILMLFLISITAYSGEWMSDNNGWWYQLDNGNYPINRISTIDGQQYAFNQDGYMLSKEWFQWSGDWYYFQSNGIMAKSQWIDGRYYVDERGRMVTNSWTPDGYYVGADGAWVDNSSKAGSTQNGSSYNQSSSSKTSSSVDREIHSGGAYYWTPNGKSYHSTPNCRSLARSRTIYSGTLSDAKQSGKTDPCNNCIR